MTFGEYIRTTRESKALTRRQVAASAGVSAAFVSDIEQGHRLPSNLKLAGLSFALGIPLGDLVKLSSVERAAELRRKANELDPA